jgi:hypothetical protein
MPLPSILSTWIGEVSYMKLPMMNIAIPKPTMSDLMAIAVVIVGAVLAASSWALAASRGVGQSLSTEEALGFALLQLGVCTASLLTLGLTARRGTIIGDLASVTGLMIGISGGLLSATLWTLA